MNMLMRAIKIQENMETELELKECDRNERFKEKSQGQGYDLAFGFHAREK